MQGFYQVPGPWEEETAAHCRDIFLNTALKQYLSQLLCVCEVIDSDSQEDVQQGVWITAALRRTYRSTVWNPSINSSLCLCSEKLQTGSKKLQNLLAVQEFSQCTPTSVFLNVSEQRIALNWPEINFSKKKKTKKRGNGKRDSAAFRACAWCYRGFHILSEQKRTLREELTDEKSSPVLKPIYYLFIHLKSHQVKIDSNFRIFSIPQLIYNCDAAAWVFLEILPTL